MIREASAGDPSELAWFKSGYSDTSNPNDCVEVAAVPGAIHVRDSKDPEGGRLGFAREAWADFVSYASGS
ncbi:DUF397 domain-containing protein [Streptomyces sp. NPDC006660]|uniref:DUF397 domain-containing protein n=1 Tax=Streptomyces sp. NPDC006660 TaxID=3156901 RepID=UPI0033DF7DC6